MTGVDLLDSHGNPLVEAVSGSDVMLRVFYSVKPGETLKGGLLVLDLGSDLKSFIGLSTGLSSKEELQFSGEGSIDFLVPKWPLLGGRYSLSVYLEAEGEAQDVVDDAAIVDTVDGDFFGTGKTYHKGWHGEYVLVPHAWEQRLKPPPQADRHQENLCGLPRRAARFGAGRLGLPGFRPKAPEPCRDVYSISIYEGGTPLDLRPGAGATIRAPGRRCHRCGGHLRGGSLHDPLRRRMAHVLRDLPQADEKGVIALASSADGFKWGYRQVVLDEPFHLSYPYVFEFEGEHYMVPESHQDRSLRLYRAVDFPTRWEHACNLIEVNC